MCSQNYDRSRYPWLSTQTNCEFICLSLDISCRSHLFFCTIFNNSCNYFCTPKTLIILWVLLFVCCFFFSLILSPFWVTRFKRFHQSFYSHTQIQSKTIYWTTISFVLYCIFSVIQWLWRQFSLLLFFFCSEHGCAVLCCCCFFFLSATF